MKRLCHCKLWVLLLISFPALGGTAENFACKTVEFVTDKDAPDFVEYNKDRLFMITIRSDEIRVKDPIEEIYKILERRNGKIFAHSYWGMDNGEISKSYNTLLFDTVNANGVVTFSHLQRPGANTWVLQCIH